MGQSLILSIPKKEGLQHLNKLTLKYHLMRNSISFIGVVNQKGEVEFNGDDIAHSQYIIVLSDGEV